MPERKKTYIDEKPYYRNCLGNLEKFESEIQKEALDFTLEDWREAFLYLQLNTKLFSSGEKAEIALSGFRGYLEDNGLSDMSEQLRIIAEEVGVLSYATATNIDRVRTRDGFLNDIIYKIEDRNVRDAGIYLCLFDGIKGKGNLYIRAMLDREDFFAENKVIISINEKEELFTVSSETIKYLEKINQQTHYYSRSNPEGIYNKTGYMFRSSGEDKTGMMPESTFHSTLKKLRPLSTNDAIISGEINCLVYAEHIYNKKLVEDINFCKRLQKRYRANVQYVPIMKAYRDYKKTNDIQSLVNSNYIDEMKSIIDEISKMPLTDKELAYTVGITKGEGKRKRKGIYIEGGVKHALHRCKERNHSLIKEAKELWLETHEHLECEICNSIPYNKYGEKGDNAIEGHHTKPIKSLTQKTIMNVKDIKLVCSNCHSIIHSSKKITLSITEVKKIISKDSTYKYL